MTIDDRLATAAASIGTMPDATIAWRLEELEARRRQRSGLLAARRTAEADSLDLDWASYQLASQHDEAGNLDAAARWYRMAAGNDFADAALRLGRVLEMLAVRRAESTGGPSRYASQRDELALVSEAARWYAEAYAAGYAEAAERLDDMISCHDTRRPRAAAPLPAADPQANCCEQGGLDAVVNGGDLITAMRHFRRCTACQHEFLRRGGLLPQPPSIITQNPVIGPGERDLATRETAIHELTG